MSSVQLYDAIKAAFVADSTSKDGHTKDTTQTGALKSLNMQSDKEEEQKKQEGRLEPGTMSENTVSEMTETFNELMDKINCNIEFSYNKDADVLNVKMIDKETKEVIKEFPPEEMIENMIKAKDWLGAFIDRAI
jgi:flagellar protein FlaG